MKIDRSRFDEVVRRELSFVMRLALVLGGLGFASAFPNDLTTFAFGVAGASGTGPAENGYDGGAYLNITTAKTKATTTLKTTLDTSMSCTYMLRIRPKDVSLSGYGALDDEIVNLLDTLKVGSKCHFAT